MTVLAFAALAAWVAVLLLPWQPHRTRERLEAADGQSDLGDVTVLIPARNEASVIDRTLAAMSRQGPGLEVVVIDDESDDGTLVLCAALAAAHCGTTTGPAANGAYPFTLRVVPGLPRPTGWSGKLWALQQGLTDVRRRRVLLLDADIELAPGTIAALLEQSDRAEADLVSIMATLRCRTFVEKLLAPPFVFFFKLIYPFALANAAHRRTAAAAGGCVLVTTEALRSMGGFAPLRGALIDDCTLAATLKSRGYRTWIGLSRSVRSRRAYSLGDFWRMVSRTAFTQLRCSILLLLGTTASLLLVFVAPIVAIFAARSPLEVAAGLGALAAMSCAYLPVVRFYKLPAQWALTLPVAAVLFLGMTLNSAFSYWRGVRARWKGRDYQAAE